jgi:hypothetical protein
VAREAEDHGAALLRQQRRESEAQARRSRRQGVRRRLARRCEEAAVPALVAVAQVALYAFDFAEAQAEAVDLPIGRAWNST